MGNYTNIKATIDANIKANNNEEITGTVLNSVLNQGVDAIGEIVGDSANTMELTPSSFSGLLWYSGSVGFVSAAAYNPNFDGWIVPLQKGATYQWGAPVNNVILTPERPYEGYVPSSFDIIGETTYTADGTYKYAFVSVFKPNGTTVSLSIGDYGLVKDVRDLLSLPGEIASIKDGSFTPVWCDDAQVSGAISEIYIDGYNDLYLTSISPDEGRIAIDDASGNRVFDYGYDPGDDVTAGVTHKLHRRRGENDAFVVFKAGGSAYTGIHAGLSPSSFNLAYSPVIHSYLLNGGAEVKTWCADANVNLHIEELYIENYASILGASAEITSCEVSSSGLRLGISNGTDNVIFFAKNFESQLGSHARSKLARDVYFGCGAISNLYSVPYADGTIEFRGYVKFRYTGEDYVASGLHARVNGGLVGDVSHSPTIKKMIEDDRQIVLIGDSHPSYPMLENTLTDIIQGKLHIRAYNLCFGGCTMAWRTQGGSDNYDSYTFVSLVDALVDRNFTRQLANVQIQDYSRQVCDLLRVDVTKPMQFLVEYGGNDWANGIPIGNLWEDDGVFDVCSGTQVAAKLASLDKSSLVGALNYGLLKLYANYPLLVQTQILGCNVIIRDNSFDGSNRMRYNQTNSLGKTLQEYDDALEGNCVRTGTRWADYPNNGIYNAFAMRFDNNAGTGITQGGSAHNEPTGYAMMAQYWINIVETYYVKYK